MYVRRNGRLGDIIKAVSYAFWTSTRGERSATYLFQGIVQIFPASGARPRPSSVQRGDSFSIFRRYSTVGISKKKRYAVSGAADAILAWHFLLARIAKPQTRRSRERGKANECICMWGRLGFKTCRKPHKHALHSIIFIFALTTGDYQETTEGAISHFVNGGGKNQGRRFSRGVVVC